MQLLLKAKYIILSVLFLIVLLVGTKNGWLVQRYTFSQTLQYDLKASSELEPALKRCLKSCDAKDKNFASRLLQEVLIPIRTEEATLENKLSEIRKIMNEAIQNYTETRQVKSAVEVYEAALSLNSRISYIPERDLQFANDIHAGIERLVARFPRNGHAYYILGKSLYQRNSRDEKSIAAFKKCLSILPTEQACKNGIENSIEAYTQARCEVSGFAPDVVFSVELKDGTAMPLRLGSNEITEIWQDSSDTSNEDATKVLLVRFSEAGMAELRKAYRENGATGIVLKKAETVVAKASLSLESFLSSNTISFQYSPIVETVANSDGEAAVGTGGEAAVQVKSEAQLQSEVRTSPLEFESVCANPHRPELPQKLSL